MDQVIQSPSEPNDLKLFTVVVLIIFIGVGGFIAGQQFEKRQKSLKSKTVSDQTASLQLTPSPIQQEKVIELTEITPSPEWIRTNTLGVVSFEYPANWHVAVLWPVTGTGGINVTIDKEPINTAPRGGSLDDLFINVLNGVVNPEEKLQEKINDFKKGLEDSTETEIEGLSGKIKYVKGKTIFFGETQPIEGYFFLIPASNQSDKINYQVISVSIGSESYKAPYLRQIIESFKREH